MRGHTRGAWLTAIILSACRGDGTDTARETDDADTADTAGGEAWWVDVEDGLRFHLQGLGEDRDYDWGTTGGSAIECVHYESWDRIEVAGSSAGGDFFGVVVCEVAALDGRIHAVDELTLIDVECADFPAYYGEWYDMNSVNDVGTRPLDAAETAECWMDVRYDGIEIVARFDCPYLRSLMPEDVDDPEAMSVVGTARCPVVEYGE
jgi:hypothetical protein